MHMHTVSSQLIGNENAENFTLFLVTNSKKEEFLNAYQAMFDIFDVCNEIRRA